MRRAEFRTVAILGAGTIGASWACFYASKGLKVSVLDVTAERLEQGLTRAKDFLGRLH